MQADQEYIVSISPVSSSTGAAAVAAVQQERTEATRGGRDVRNDGDSDDVAAAQTAAKPQPTANTSGQQIGAVVNTTA